ncbi:hypothetical protein ABW19_dt0202094 [Dactylella cylindrospora]|nr:hypothetical protein ABW19_dt0202094 [Dactylella cylindrospora]
MHYSNLLLFFVGSAFATRRCAAPAPECVNCETSSASCIAKISSAGTIRPTCISYTTLPTPTVTSTKKIGGKRTVTVSETSTVWKTFIDPSYTVTDDDVVTSTSTITDKSTITSYPTVTTTDIITRHATTVVTSTTSIGAPGARLGRVRALKREPIPSICSCFLTKTVASTRTPDATTVTETVKKPKKTVTTTTTFYVTSTSTRPIATATSTEVVRTTISDVDTVLVSRTATVSSTTTLVSTSVVVHTAWPTPDTSCGNQGLAFAINKHSFVNQDASYSSFDPTYFKAKTPHPDVATGSGATNIIGGIVSQPPAGIEDAQSIYGKPARVLTYVSVNHRGYIFARQSGQYTFSAPAVDDITFLWTGEKAVKGWTRTNADIIQPYVGAGAPDVKTFSVNLVVGQYFPFRVMWANGQGWAKFDFQIKAPNGEIIIGAKTGPSPYLVQYSCDGKSAPRFPNFGQEV